MMQKLPKELFQQIQTTSGESEARQLASVSKTMHSMFPFTQLLDKFLQCVAFGMQDKAEKLFCDVYSGHPAKIQEALRYQGVFTDYSGRTFNCSAYEYAYWAKDTHMCRMLARDMDEETKAQILARIDIIEAVGLLYQQNGEAHQRAHFDFTPLKEAYQRYINGYEAWATAENWDAINAAWLAVGMAQRDVPAHVAQEYCRRDHGMRVWDPTPDFNDVLLPRGLTFCHFPAELDTWFPLSGLGFNFAIVSAHYHLHPLATGEGRRVAGAIGYDFAAITRLDEVRTSDLRRAREYLAPAASPRMGL